MVFTDNPPVDLKRSIKYTSN